MKTILATLEFPPSVGGVEKYYQALASNWPEEFIVIDNHDNKLLSKNGLWLKWLAGVKTIIKTVRDTQADWVMAGEILPIGTATYLASFFTTFKYAVVLHGFDFSLATKSAWKNFLTKKILQKSNLIFCANSYTAKLVSNYLKDGSKVRLANPGVDSQEPAIRPELIAGLKANYDLAGKKILLTVGRLVKRKGFAEVLAVLPEILEANPNLRYFIIGDGPEENNLKQLLTDPALIGKAFLLNSVTQEEKWAWLKISDIFIMCPKDLAGDYEGFGIVYLEANLFSKPVIATNSGGVADAVVDGLNGRLIKPDDASALKQTIIDLVNNEALCQQLGEQGKTRVLNDFTWPVLVNKIYNLLKANL